VSPALRRQNNGVKESLFDPRLDAAAFEAAAREVLREAS
jgi:hypothetical protein